MLQVPVGEHARLPPLHWPPTQHGSPWSPQGWQVRSMRPVQTRSLARHVPPRQQLSSWSPQLGARQVPFRHEASPKQPDPAQQMSPSLPQGWQVLATHRVPVLQKPPSQQPAPCAPQATHVPPMQPAPAAQLPPSQHTWLASPQGSQSPSWQIEPGPHEGQHASIGHTHCVPSQTRPSVQTSAQPVMPPVSGIGVPVSGSVVPPPSRPPDPASIPPPRRVESGCTSALHAGAVRARTTRAIEPKQARMLRE